ncbi:MAG: alpha-L-rhamnosidase C-terminal domain-containing protein, partial [Kiritimatiellae bacterium]|nr:alpha-L-rhamnosidase C-terminal domain-containing protein [Kiritimatiellia bacterium]
NAAYFRILGSLRQVTGDDGYAKRAERLRDSLQRLILPYVNRNGPRVERLVPDLFVRKDGEWEAFATPEAWNFADTRPNRSETTNAWVLWSGVLDEAHANRLWEVVQDWRIDAISRRDHTRLFNVARSEMYGLWPRLVYARERGDAAVLYRDVRDAVGPMALHGDSLWEHLTEDARSSAHAFAAFSGALLYEGLTGIRPGPQGGYRHCLIDPQLDDSIRWARGHMEIEQGTIGVNWRQTADSFEMSVGLPSGVTAEVRLPPAALGIALRGGHRLEGRGWYAIESSATFVVTFGEGVRMESGRPIRTL